VMSHLECQVNLVESQVNLRSTMTCSKYIPSLAICITLKVFQLPPDVVMSRYAHTGTLTPSRRMNGYEAIVTLVSEQLTIQVGQLHCSKT
jgi:hypothetical protein